MSEQPQEARSAASFRGLYAVAWPGGSAVLSAATVEDACEQAKNKVSVGALRHGVVFSVWRLGNFPEKYHIAYDGEPLTESHGATSAKLVTKPLGRSHV